jgi:hypothetical protein
MKKLEKMKWFNTSVLLLFLFAGSQSLYGQVDKMKQSMEDENYKRVLKIFESSMEDSKKRKNPEIYYLNASALFELMRDPFYLKKNPDSYKKGLKMLSKAAGYDKDQEVYYEYESVINNYVKVNNGLARDYYEINKYGKAKRTYNQSYVLNKSIEAYYMGANCTLLMLDTADAEKLFDLLITKYDDEFSDSKSNKGMYIDPFLYFVDKYWNSARYDSANYYLHAARKIFGAQERLDYFQMEVAKAQIKSLPPSSLMMEVIQRNLNYFPRDTFLLHKENALYLYMIRTAIGANRDVRADTLIDQMARSKIRRSRGDLAEDFKIIDSFYETKYENVLWKLTSYYYKYNHNLAGEFTADMYIRATANDSTKEAILDRWLVIIDYAAKKKSLSLGAELLEFTKTSYPGEIALTDLENSLALNFKNKELGTKDLGALRRMLINTNQQDEDYNKLSSSYIDKLIKEKDYRLARIIIDYESIREPESKIWRRKKIYLAKDDFYNNYYMTRIKEETVAGMKVNGFEWNGKTYECDPGEIDDEIQQKVENRINYFRRNAGLEDIYLDNELNAWCQKAALMMEANKRLNHEPNTRWSCYTDQGATAARYSLLTKGAHTTLAVTSFFADNQNPSVGNRRWLLYPNAKAFGHGSTGNYTVIWALDDSGNVDTSQFKNKFVSWPPEGFIPKMMTFRYWSFSLSQDLSGAEIEVFENGQNVAIKQQDLVVGYGMNTLVWEPQTDFKDMQNDRIFHVVVKLTNGRIYEYDVTVLDFEAKGY